MGARDGIVRGMCSLRGLPRRPRCCGWGRLRRLPPWARWPGATPATCCVRAMGAEVCQAAFPFSSSTALQDWCHHGGGAGWLVLGTPSTRYACGAMVALRVVPSLLFGRCIAEAAGSEQLPHGRERAAGMRFSRAKAFTDTSVSGDGGVIIGASFSLLGVPLWSTMPGSTGVLGVKTLSSYGRATMVSLVSCPSWRRHFLRPTSACGSVGGILFGGVARTQPQWRCTGSMSEARCRGPMSARGLGLARMVRW
jgi:hypothetical protein